MLGFQNHFLIEKKFLQFHVRCELEAEWLNPLFEELMAPSCHVGETGGSIAVPAA